MRKVDSDESGLELFVLGERGGAKVKKAKETEKGVNLDANATRTVLS